MSKKYFISIFLLLLFNVVLSQNDNKRLSTPETRILSYQELLDEMVSCKDSVYELNKAIIQYDAEKDKSFVSYKDSTSYSKLDSVIVKVRVDLKQVSFRDYEIGNKSSDKMLLYFSKIEFEKEVSIKDAIVSNDIGFRNTKFHSRFEFTMDSESLDNRIILSECLFNGYVQINISKGLIYVAKSEFNAVNEKEDKGSNNGNLFFSNDEKSFIQFAQNNFRKNSELDFTQVGGKLYSLRLYENHFETDFKFSEMSIEDLTVRGNDFKAFIDMTNVNFGSFKSELYYNEIANKVGVYSNLDIRGRVWRPKNEESFQDSVASERLFSTYRRITDHFKNRGNLRDYNSMYMEMKDMETLQLQYFYKKDKNLQNWFSWRMNQFLGSFSNYGTSPVKAIIYAIKVILFFSLFFFFFHNSWDTFTKEQLMSRILLLTKYFRSEEGIADLYEEQERHRYKTYEDFMAYINEGRAEIPKLFFWIAKPLYKLSMIEITSTYKLLNKTEILSGKWKELDKKKQWKTSIIGGFILLSYLILSLVMKVLNAVMLSVNSFTTLGFGEIPTRGFGRYAAIIEGFIGWFLLTLFSVSLISQLLQ